MSNSEGRNTETKYFVLNLIDGQAEQRKTAGGGLQRYAMAELRISGG